MARLETVVEPLIRGAGRSLDISFPANIIQTVGNNTLGNLWVNRQGFTTFNMGSSTTAGGGGANDRYQTYRGRIAFKWSNTNPAASWFFTGSQANGLFPCQFPTQNGGDGGFFSDDFRCWQVTAISAYSNPMPDGTAGQNGLVMGPLVDGYDVFFNAVGAAGIRFGPGPDAASFSVQARQVTNGAFTANQTVVTGTDITDWHALTIRMVGATNTNEAVVRFIFDGNTVLSLPFGAGTVLPSISGGTVQGGWGIAFGCKILADAYLAQNGLQVVAASTEAALP